MLLERPSFSILDAVYDFQRREPLDKIQELPEGLVSEAATVLALLPLFGTDLEKPFLPMLCACDAAPEYGFGASVRSCTVDEAMAVGRLSEKRGDYIRLNREASDQPQKLRIGKAHKLPYFKSEFKDVLCVRARVKEHSGLLECQGLLLLVKWLLRAVGRHHHQVPILVDAKTILCAASKGRSSSPALLRILRKLAANVLAGGMSLRLVYVPSEDNPADAPSRGLRRRPFERRRFVKIKQKEKRILQRERLRLRIRQSPHAEELEALMAMELLSSSSGSF
jgi:hypothetical protein